VNRLIPRFRFRLVTMFAVVGLVACGLAALQLWIYVPMRSGTMHTAVISRQDWVRLVSSRPAYQQGDFTMYAFGATTPQDLLKDFCPTPQLWGEINLTRFGRYDIHMLARTRPGHSPLGGWKDWKVQGDEWETDRLGICGVFEESAIPPKRYVIDCNVALTIGIRPTEPAGAPCLRSRLRYTGPARGLMVFSRPIDDELVQLLIFDLR
jgi:hypothetical protein